MAKLSSLYDDFEDRTGRRKIIRIEEATSRSMTLELYRGFDADLDDIARTEDGKFELSPARSEQGLLWFTHKMISGYDPIEYARSRGDWLLTYPLICTRHYQRYWYDDGDYYDQIPNDILTKTVPFENCRFHIGIELPDGWVFSYKTQKFIGCEKLLYVDHDMITKVI